jgi:hypothetical protein
MYTIKAGNPYEWFREGDVICTTTNGIVRKNGCAVMGRGNARFVRDVFGVDRKLGSYLHQYGNRAFYLGEYVFPKLEGFEPSEGKKVKIATFPTKHHWRDKSDPDLIEESSKQLVSLADKFGFSKVYVPIPGGSNGKLKWKEIEPRLCSLDERFVIYSLEEGDFD